MTVCLAAISDDGKVVNYCADKMVSNAATLSQVDRPDIDKFMKLTENCVILFSGALGYIDEVIRVAQKEISRDKHNGIIEVEKAAEDIRDAFKKVRDQWVERSILEPKGLKLADGSARDARGPSSRCSMRRSKRGGSMPRRIP